MKKKIIFFVRHFNDYDHFTPIIWSLAKTHRFKVTVFFTDPFNEISFRKNYRTELLTKNGVDIIGFSNSNYNFKFLLPLIGKLFRYDNTIFNLNKITSLIGGIILNFLFKRKFQESFIKKKSFNLIEKNYSILVFDHMLDQSRREIINYSKNFDCTSIALPHGLTLFSNKKLEKIRKNQALEYKIFDKVVFPNYLNMFYSVEKKILKDNFLGLGSPRFSKTWINFIQKKIKKKKPKIKKNLNILFLIEKEFTFFNKKKIIITDYNKQFQILEFLKTKKNFSFLVKTNTRGITQNQLEYLKKSFSKNLTNDETSDLIKWSDVVICGGGTSVILQSISTNVPTICCTYLHPNHKFYFKNFKYPIEVKSFRELKDLIDKNKFLKNKAEKYKKNFLNKIIMLNKDPLKLHSKFFSSLK